MTSRGSLRRRASARGEVSSVLAGGECHPKDYLYFINLVLFATTILLSIALVKFGIPGLPLRAFTAILILALTLAASPWIVGQALRSIGSFLAVVAVCAFFGLLSSVLNGAPLDQIFRQLLEIHFQACIGLLVGACLVRTCGATAVVAVMVLCVGLSVAVATLQFVGLGLAWDLRNFLQRIQPIEIDQDTVFLTLRLRAMGLSFSPVHLGTQICLAFAGWFSWVLYYSRGREFSEFNLILIVGLCAALFGAIVSGNRSPILGIVIFLLGYIFIARPALAIILGIICMPMLFFVDELTQEAAEIGLRAVRTDDGSSSNRKVLRAFGFLLFQDRPYGYGMAFSSIEHWTKFWEKLKNYPNPTAVQIHALHNYYMMIINKYGFLMIFVGSYVLYKLLNNKYVLLAFAPYIIHIFYHNDGPLQGDFLIWFLLPSVLSLQKAAQSMKNERAAVRSLAPGGAYPLGESGGAGHIRTISGQRPVE